MDSLRGIISDLHVFLYGGMRTLPITIAGTMLILGLFTANYAMMFFLVGFMIATPSLSAVLNAIIDATASKWGIDWFKSKTSDVCNVVIPYSTLDKPSKVEDVNILCPTSYAMICFFLGYMLTNAVELYRRGTDPKADETKVSTRKSHAILSILSIIVFTIIVIGFRMTSKCESTIGLIIGILIFGPLGYGWYKMLSKSNEGRLADLFGISNRILPASAMKLDGPVACFADPSA
jgi:hypothetical protein